jgi:hypothetical protein
MEIGSVRQVDIDDANAKPDVATVPACLACAIAAPCVVAVSAAAEEPTPPTYPRPTTARAEVRMRSLSGVRLEQPMWPSGLALALGLARPVDRNTTINDKTIRHAISFTLTFKRDGFPLIACQQSPQLSEDTTTRRAHIAKFSRIAWSP